MIRTASNWNVESPLARSKLLRSQPAPLAARAGRRRLLRRGSRRRAAAAAALLENQITREHRITVARAKAIVFFIQLQIQ